MGTRTQRDDGPFSQRRNGLCFREVHRQFDRCRLPDVFIHTHLMAVLVRPLEGAREVPSPHGCILAPRMAFASNHARKGARMFAICRAISLSRGTQSSFPQIIMRTM
jgi:hypothetical protein